MGGGYYTLETYDKDEASNGERGGIMANIVP